MTTPTSSSPLTASPIQASSRNRIVAPIILGITIMLGILITRPYYNEYIEKQATLTKLNTELEELTSDHEHLSKIQNNSEGSGITDMRERVEKIRKKLSRADILSAIMLNDYTKETYEKTARIHIEDVTIGNQTLLPNGLSLTPVDITLMGKTIDDIVEYISFLTKNTPYAFTLDNINLPLDTAPDGEIPEGYNLSFSLGIYSYEAK